MTPFLPFLRTFVLRNHPKNAIDEKLKTNNLQIKRKLRLLLETNAGVLRYTDDEEVGKKRLTFVNEPNGQSNTHAASREREREEI